MKILHSVAASIAAILALFAPVTGCSSVRISPVDTTLARSVPDGDALFSDVLRAHVNNGLVDYVAIQHDPRFARYISWIGRARPSRLTNKNARLAFWINTYNAWTLKLIADNYPVHSINDLHSGGRILGHVFHTTVWDRKVVQVGATRYSLNDIEHRIIRRRFRDPRVHFALVCAALSCPSLRSEAYTAARLNAQLDDQARLFFAQPAKNHFDVATKTAWLSKILDWYRGDFAGDTAGLLRRIARYLPDPVRRSIERNADAWHVRHTPYNWALNEQPGSSH